MSNKTMHRALQRLVEDEIGKRPKLTLDAVDRAVFAVAVSNQIAKL